MLSNVKPSEFSGGFSFDNFNMQFNSTGKFGNFKIFNYQCAKCIINSVGL